MERLMSRFVVIGLVILLINLNNNSFAEVIKTKNDHVYKGEIVSINDKLIEIKTDEGKIKVKRTKIKEIELDDSNK